MKALHLNGQVHGFPSLLGHPQTICRTPFQPRAAGRSLGRQQAVLIFAANRAPAVVDKPQTADYSNGVTQTTMNLKRKISVTIQLTNPGSLLPELNWGKIILHGDNGLESTPGYFWKVKPLTVSQLKGDEPTQMKLQAVVEVPDGYSETGAVKIQDLSLLKADDRFWLESVTINDGDSTSVALAESWVCKKQHLRTIFVNKAYLPSQTPSGLQDLRATELGSLCQEDKLERQPSDRVYDYDVYNDLGTKEKDRPTLGGPRYPYPRRERSGRRIAKNDAGREYETGMEPATPAGDSVLAKILGKVTQKKYYIPMDEEFSATKQTYFQKDTILGLLPVFINTLAGNLFRGSLKEKAFSSIPAVASFYKDEVWRESTTVPGPFQLRSPTPMVYEGRTTAWDTDQEVGRQALAGQNPCMLQALQALPTDSAITMKHIEGSVEGHNLQELLAGGKRLFQVDYTIFSQFLPEINQQEVEAGKPPVFMYATRAVFYLNDENLLKPIAIELVSAPDNSKKQRKVRQVYTPHGDTHLWRLAKTFFASNDSGYHQLISHWLRTHACTEPYIIATRRRLSALHPVYALLHPHFKYTMPINRNARQNLVNAGGTIESTFAPGKYAMGISSAVYGLLWRFDQEALPADLLQRGMISEKPDGDILWKGKRYTRVLEDYPYADDGLLIWDALHTYFSKFLKIYYTDDSKLVSDPEIMGWWQDIREKGHPDKKEGWPSLKTVADLTDILTTMVWVASGHHAAVNFGQYSYSGYMPNHPSTTHAPMPDPDSNDPADKAAWAAFKEFPDKTFLKIVSTQEEALRVMLVVQLLSSYDPEEQYLGDRTDGWSSNPEVVEAQKEFKAAVEKIGETIKDRNARVERKARFPDYTLLAPQGDDNMHERIRGHGVPNSISI